MSQQDVTLSFVRGSENAESELTSPTMNRSIFDKRTSEPLDYLLVKDFMCFRCVLFQFHLYCLFCPTLYSDLILVKVIALFRDHMKLSIQALVGNAIWR